MVSRTSDWTDELEPRTLTRGYSGCCRARGGRALRSVGRRSRQQNGQDFVLPQPEQAHAPAPRTESRKGALKGPAIPSAGLFMYANRVLLGHYVIA
jgi:hypothetical protein